MSKKDKDFGGLSYLADEFPSNSNKGKEEEKKVDKVISGKVVQKKKGVFRRTVDALTGDDRESVGEHLLYDVLIPAAKNTLSDLVKGGIDMFLYGSVRPSGVRRDRDRSYVSYSSRYNTRNDHYGRSRPSRQQISPRSRATHNFDEIILESRAEAEEVLGRLVDLIMDYDMATVADLYDLIGITSNFTDNKYGWTDLSRAAVVRVREGYLLQLPRTEVLD